MSDLDVIRRIADRGMKLAQERAPEFIDLFQHMKDEIARVPSAPSLVSVTLTGKEIREIAEFAGLQFVEHDYQDEYETEITVEACPSKGVLNDDNVAEHYRLIAFLTEYPEEGCLPLGEKIDAPRAESAPQPIDQPAKAA